MAGTILRLLPRTDFDFAKVQVNSTVTVWMGQNFDVSRYREGTLLVRVHAQNIGTTSTILVGLRSVLPSKEDPAQFFRGSTDLAFVQLGNPIPAAPSLHAVALPANFGGMLSLSVRGSQPGTLTTLTATLSVDLSLKD